MKGYVKAFIVAGILFAIGLVFVIVGGIMLGFDYDIPNEGDVSENYSATIDDTHTSIDLDMMACEIIISPSHDEKTSITYFNAPKHLKVNDSLQGQKLTVWQTSNPPTHVSAHPTAPTMKITLAKGVTEIEIKCNAGMVTIRDLTLASLSVETDAGTVDLSSVNAEKMEIETSAGSVKLNSVDSTEMEIETSMGSINGTKVTSDHLLATTSMGSIQLQMTGALQEYTVKTDVSMGNSNVTNQTGTTEKSLELNADLGSINVTFIK